MKDQELDKLMRQITRDAALDEGSVDEIADSSTLWWSVQREIRNAGPAKTPWPPNYLRKLLMIGVPVAAAVLIGLGVHVNSLRTVAPEMAKSDPAKVPQTSTDPAPAGDPRQISTESKAVADQVVPSEAKAALERRHAVSVPKTFTAKVPVKPAAEIKSEFIALAYARSPESGQLVRVKVPSSMMVSLGVVPTVSDPSKLIDAEVLVGDDGLSRSIRFIRQ
ncbi:MAG: hypothetical protein ACJ73D_06040 [Pyrinomonadaceae bacterium]